MTRDDDDTSMTRDSDETRDDRNSRTDHESTTTPANEERGEWPVLESRTEYETPWYDGGHDLVEQPDGTQKRYYWAELPDAVVVVARIDGSVVSDGSTSEDHVLFVEQYRPTIRETCLELPAGIVEDGESYTTAAARELEEETGFAPSSLALIQEYAVATGLMRHNRAIVYADGLELGQQALDTNEFLEVHSIPVSDTIQQAREQPANDSTISALLLAFEDDFL